MSKLAVMVVSFAALFLGIFNSEPVRALALSTGTLTTTSSPYLCTHAPNGSMFYSGMSCVNATISCPNTADINLVFGYTGPSSPQGTIVLFPGGSGITPSESGDDIPT